MPTEKTPRARKLHAISGTIAPFVVQATSTDEQAAQRVRSEAIGKIDAARDLRKAADERATQAQEGRPRP